MQLEKGLFSGKYTALKSSLHVLSLQETESCPDIYGNMKGKSLVKCTQTRDQKTDPDMHSNFRRLLLLQSLVSCVICTVLSGDFL